MPDVGKAVATLADVSASIGGNMHTLHLNFKGEEFDTYHKRVLQEYYQECDEDYDALAEWACCYDYEVQNKNESAERIDFKSFNGMTAREDCVNKVNDYLENLVDAFHQLYVSVNKIEDCPISVGLANWLQGRIEYWAKELHYFNKRRKQ